MDQKNNIWTLVDYDTIYRKYPFTETEELAQQLGRTTTGVDSRASKLGIRKHEEFTESELNTAKMYGVTLGLSLIFLLPHRTTDEIRRLLQCIAE